MGSLIKAIVSVVCFLTSHIIQYSVYLTLDVLGSLIKGIVSVVCFLTSHIIQYSVESSLVSHE